MSDLVIVGFLILAVAIVMTMVGKGGGNFYIVILTIANIPMHEAATTGQFILFSASVAAMIIFQKSKSVLWGLAIVIGSVTALSALGGGYFSYLFSNFTLKMLFALMLLIAGIVMLIPVSKKTDNAKKRYYGNHKY